ncbi:MAG TPA: YegP family protein [Ilumatobacteraceae bacterium]|nr:YegP family protein [Ilumatobacteraceae bacterium]
MASGAKLLVYQRADKKWAWQLKAANGNVIATDGSQGYENVADCRNMATKIVLDGVYHDAEIVDGRVVE